MASVVVLIFSKHRPLQLEGCLESFFRHCQTNLVDVRVLFRGCSTEYDQVAAQFPQVVFIPESDFRKQVLRQLSQFFYSHVLFVVDDTVFLRPFDVTLMQKQLAQFPKALGFSMRLGLNTTRCYVTDQLQSRTLLPGPAHRWDWTKATMDFGYPLELSSSLYRLSDMYLTIASLPFSNPNTLEAAMDRACRSKTFAWKHKTELLGFPISVAVSLPMNVVTKSWTNRASSNPQYSTKKLLQKFRQGWRMDTKKLDGYRPHACHEEITFSFRKKFHRARKK